MRVEKYMVLWTLFMTSFACGEDVNSGRSDGEESEDEADDDGNSSDFTNSRLCDAVNKDFEDVFSSIESGREFLGCEFSLEAGNCQSSNRCLLYTSPSPRDATLSRMPSYA